MSSLCSKVFRIIVLGYIARLVVGFMHIANIKDDPRCKKEETTPENEGRDSPPASSVSHGQKSSLARFLTPSNLLGSSASPARDVSSCASRSSRTVESQRTSLTLDESYSQSPLAERASKPVPILNSISESKSSFSMDKLEGLLDGPNGQFVTLILAAAEFEDKQKSSAREAAVLSAERLGMKIQDFSSEVTLLKGPGTSEFGFVDSETEQNHIDDIALPSRIPVTLSINFDEKSKLIELILKAYPSDLDEFGSSGSETGPIMSKISLFTLTQVVNGRRKALANDYPDLRSVPSNQFCTLVATPSLDIMFNHSSARDAWGSAFKSIIHGQVEGDQLWNIYSNIRKALH